MVELYVGRRLFILTLNLKFNKNLRLRLLKALVNVPLRLIDWVVPDVDVVTYPQSKMLLRVFKRFERAYRLDVEQGTFDVPDGNFERFLRVSRKVLLRVCEDDRYYRAWVGLGIILAGDEKDWFNEEVSELKRLIRAQWCTDIRFLPDCVVAENKRDFLEVALCDYLARLAVLPEEDE